VARPETTIRRLSPGHAGPRRELETLSMDLCFPLIINNFYEHIYIVYSNEFVLDLFLMEFAQAAKRVTLLKVLNTGKFTISLTTAHLFLFSGTEPTLHDHGVSYIQNNIHSAIEV
jgi:hypothetical protein